jgi:hypothetical protein
MIFVLNVITKKRFYKSLCTFVKLHLIIFKYNSFVKFSHKPFLFKNTDLILLPLIIKTVEIMFYCMIIKIIDNFTLVLSII